LSILPFPPTLGEKVSFGVLSVPRVAYENNTQGEPSQGSKCHLLKDNTTEQEPASLVQVIQRRMNLVSDNTVKEMAVNS